jgi:predicted transcriptional regulator
MQVKGQGQQQIWEQLAVYQIAQFSSQTKVLFSKDFYTTKWQLSTTGSNNLGLSLVKHETVVHGCCRILGRNGCARRAIGSPRSSLLIDERDLYAIAKVSNMLLEQSTSSAYVCI